MSECTHVDEEEVGRTALRGLACRHLCPKGSSPANTVGRGGLAGIRRRYAKDQLVQIVVDEEHLGAGICTRRGSIHVAVERGVSNIESSLPDAPKLLITKSV